MEEDPAVFAHLGLGIDIYKYPQQVQMLKDVAKYRKVAIRSGHKIGKTTVFSILTLWFMIFRPNMTVILTSGGKQPQMNTGIKPEIRKWLAKADYFLQSMVDFSETKIKQTHYDGFTEFRSSTLNAVEAWQGTHNDEYGLAFLIDEGSGFPNIHWDAIQGSIQGEAVYVVVAGNPVRLSGFFFDAFHNDRSLWHLLHFSSLDSPRCNKEWQKKKLKIWGKDSSEYRVKILGEFPLQESDSLISYEDFEYATEKANDEVEPNLGEHVWALDPSDMGNDESVLTKRRGNHIYEVWVKKGKVKSPVLVGDVIAQLWALKIEDRPKFVIVDAVGMGGPVTDFLEFQNVPGVTFVTFKANYRSADPAKWKMAKDEIGFKFKEFVESREVIITDDDGLFSQAVTIKYKHHPDGSKIVDKDGWKKANKGASPDRFDSASMTFYKPPTIYIA